MLEVIFWMWLIDVSGKIIGDGAVSAGTKSGYEEQSKMKKISCQS
jgi:hypothetical protein